MGPRVLNNKMETADVFGDSVTDYDIWNETVDDNRRKDGLVQVGFLDGSSDDDGDIAIVGRPSTSTPALSEPYPMSTTSPDATHRKSQSSSFNTSNMATVTPPSPGRPPRTPTLNRNKFKVEMFSDLNDHRNNNNNNTPLSARRHRVVKPDDLERIITRRQQHDEFPPQSRRSPRPPSMLSPRNQQRCKITIPTAPPLTPTTTTTTTSLSTISPVQGDVSEGSRNSKSYGSKAKVNGELLSLSPAIRNRMMRRKSFDDSYKQITTAELQAKSKEFGFLDNDGDQPKQQRQQRRNSDFTAVMPFPTSFDDDDDKNNNNNNETINNNIKRDTIENCQQINKKQNKNNNNNNNNIDDDWGFAATSSRPPPSPLPFGDFSNSPRQDNNDNDINNNGYRTTVNGLNFDITPRRRRPSKSRMVRSIRRMSNGERSPGRRTPTAADSNTNTPRKSKSKTIINNGLDDIPPPEIWESSFSNLDEFMDHTLPPSSKSSSSKKNKKKDRHSNKEDSDKGSRSTTSISRTTASKDSYSSNIPRPERISRRRASTGDKEYDIVRNPAPRKQRSGSMSNDVSENDLTKSPSASKAGRKIKYERRSSDTGQTTADDNKSKTSDGGRSRRSRRSQNSSSSDKTPTSNTDDSIGSSPRVTAASSSSSSRKRSEGSKKSSSNSRSSSKHLEGEDVTPSRRPKNYAHRRASHS